MTLFHRDEMDPKIRGPRGTSDMGKMTRRVDFHHAAMQLLGKAYAAAENLAHARGERAAADLEWSNLIAAIRKYELKAHQEDSSFDPRAEELPPALKEEMKKIENRRNQATQHYEQAMRDRTELAKDLSDAQSTVAAKLQAMAAGGEPPHLGQFQKYFDQVKVLRLAEAEFFQVIWNITAAACTIIEEAKDPSRQKLSFLPPRPPKRPQQEPEEIDGEDGGFPPTHPTPPGREETPVWPPTPTGGPPESSPLPGEGPEWDPTQTDAPPIWPPKPPDFVPPHCPPGAPPFPPAAGPGWHPPGTGTPPFSESANQPATRRASRGRAIE